MFGFRTPAKTQSHPASAGTETDNEAGPSGQTKNVRRSIGEWESGQPDARNDLTPPKKTTVVAPKPKPAAVRRLSAEVAGSPPERMASKCSDRVTEARSWVCKAKAHLANSRNLKTDIKAGVTEAIDRLFRLVKETDSVKGQSCRVSPKLVPESGRSKEQELGIKIDQHMELLRQNTEKLGLLKETLEKTQVDGPTTTNAMDKLLSEVRELRQTSEETGRRVSVLHESVPSYAEVLARPTSATSPTKLRSKHSIIVSSDIEKDTSDEVLGKVRDALDAKTNGIQVTRVRKIKNQRVVISCGTRDEVTKLSDRITAKSKDLKVEEAKNKDPLVILKNLLAFNKDEDIISSLRSQNAVLLKGLAEDDFRTAVRYRRRARNPHENHVVLQVSPKLWQRLTTARRIHIDLQYVAVQDQSPLVQCTRCLGYGHGRRLCKEPADLCSFCAGPHLRADCPAYLAGETPTCRNCRLAKSFDINHNAFDGECPVRKRWDAIARSSVAYC